MKPQDVCVLQAVREFDSIPLRPAGYFLPTLTARLEIQEDNSLAKASVIRAFETLSAKDTCRVKQWVIFMFPFSKERRHPAVIITHEETCQYVDI